MNKFQKTVLRSGSDNAQPVSYHVASLLLVSEKMSLKAIPHLVERAPFSPADGVLVLAHFQKAAARNKYAYDIEPSFSIGVSGSNEALRNGIVKLSSKNFGYEFALINVDAGRGFFGGRKNVVRIYISNLHADEYSYLRSASSLSKALRTIDKMYCKAAKLHLP
jgi:hypothetical protein